MNSINILLATNVLLAIRITKNHLVYQIMVPNHLLSTFQPVSERSQSVKAIG